MFFANFCRNHDLSQRFIGSIYGLPVHFDDFFTLGAISFFDSGFNQFNGFVLFQNAGNYKKGGHHNRVDPTTQTNFPGDFQSIDVIKSDFLFDDCFLHVFGKIFENLIFCPDGVQQENSAFFNSFQNVISADESLVVTSNKISIQDQISGLNR